MDLYKTEKESHVRRYDSGSLLLVPVPIQRGLFPSIYEMADVAASANK